MGTRKRTRESILEAATTLFLQQGLIEVAMGDIANLAACTRRNLYRYFATKDDLCFAVVIELLRDWNAFQVQVFEGLQGSGLQRLRGFLTGLAHQMENQKPLLRFMGEFDFVFRDGVAFQPDAQTAASFNSVIHITEDLLEKILAMGCADGSIRLFTESAVLVPTITTVLWGMGQRIAIRDGLIQQEFGRAGIDLVLTQIEVFVRSIAAS